MKKSEVSASDNDGLYESSLEIEHFSKSVYKFFAKACSTEQSNISTLQCSISVVLNADNAAARKPREL